MRGRICALRPTTPSPSFHPPARVRLHRGRRVFRHLGRLRARTSLRRDRGRRNAVERTWRNRPCGMFQTAIVRPYVALHDDEFVVMPNHVHGIIWIVDPCRRGPPTMTIPGARHRVPSAPFWPNTNPSSPNASTPCAARPARRSGNAIITNTSSVMRRIYNASGNTSRTTRPDGRWIARTRPMARRVAPTAGHPSDNS